MMLPEIFGKNLFDGFMNDAAMPHAGDIHQWMRGTGAESMMKTDVKEKKHKYEVSIDLAGVDKDDIRMELDDGVLTLTAERGSEKSEKDENGRYIRRERYSGTMSRSFYIGDHVREKDIRPKFRNGVLTFSVPKDERRPEDESRHYITIE